MSTDQDQSGAAPPPQPAVEFTLRRIGVIRRTGGTEKLGPARIEVEAQYRDGLLELAHFSHVLVVWWAHECDNDMNRGTLRVRPRPAPDRLMGVFATRSPARPNPIAVSVCRMLAVDETNGLVDVAELDAKDDSPVVDLKAYIPSSDRVRNPDIPPWFADLPEWAADGPQDIAAAESAVSETGSAAP